MGCYYSDEEVQKWDSVCNPIGKKCYNCSEKYCVHNANDEFFEEPFEVHEMFEKQKPKVNQSHNNQQNKPCEVSLNSSHD